MANGAVISSDPKMLRFKSDAVRLKWFRPYVGIGRTFTRKNVADILSLIIGHGERRDFYIRADTLIQQALFYQEIMRFNEEKDRYCFEVKNG